MTAAPRLLIIDDEPQFRNMLRRVFEGEGYAVTTAETGAIGLLRMKEVPFPVVLCDVKLPDANGVELTSALRSIAPTAEVVVMTAFGSIPDAVQAMRNGAFQYLVKGDDNAKLLPTVSGALEQAKRRDVVPHEVPSGSVRRCDRSLSRYSENDRTGPESSAHRGHSAYDRDHRRRERSFRERYPCSQRTSRTCNARREL